MIDQKVSMASSRAVHQAPIVKIRHAEKNRSLGVAGALAGSRSTMDQSSNRRKIIAALAVIVPVLVGLVIVIFAHELGGERSDPRQETE